MMQILAPAGNADSLAAAVRSGADAFIWGRGLSMPAAMPRTLAPEGLKRR